MAYPKRTKDTVWHNESPITDLHEALWLIAEENSSFDPIHLHKHRPLSYDTELTKEIWEIIYPWYSEGDSGGDRGGVNYYQIDQALAERLVREEFVIARRVKHIGYTEIRDSELALSPQGKRHLKAHHEHMEELAVSMLQPGFHTDLTGVPPWLQRKREHGATGRLYFHFRLPNGDECYLYPETREIVYPRVLAEA